MPLTDTGCRSPQARTHVRLDHLMSELRSAIDALQAEDLHALSDDQLEADFAELQRATQALEAERLRRLCEIHRRQSHQREGYPSTASWLAGRPGPGWT